jgi:hypothetical protein
MIATTRTLCLSVWWALAAMPLYAEQSYPAVPLPGLESDPPGTVIPQGCALSVAGDQVSMDLTVKTDTDTPALLINGPLFGWTGPAEPYPDRQFPELEIRIDGDLATPADRFEAMVGETNITNLLRAAQMDPWAITRSPPVTSAHPKNAQVLAVLRNVGAIVNAGDDYTAKWTARRVLRIALKAAPIQEVGLRYKVRPGHAWLTSEQLATTSREKTYCVSWKQLRHSLHTSSDSTLLSVEEYSLPTGIDGKAPTSVTFTLTPSSSGSAAPPAALFMCGPHGKPIAKEVAVTRERVEVDDQGMVHVLSVAAAARSPSLATMR